MQGTFEELRNRQSMRHMLRFACLWMTALGLVLSVAGLLSPRVSWQVVVLCFLLVPVAWGTQQLFKRFRWKPAVVFFVWANWSLVAAMVACTGGLQSKALIAFPVWTVLAAWLLGGQQAMVLLALSAVVIVGAWAGAEQLPQHHQGLTLPLLIYAVGMMSLAVMATLIVRVSLNRREQKNREMLATLEASQQELRKFQRTVEQHPESIVITDPEQNIVYVNEAFLARTGYTRPQVLKQASQQFSMRGLSEGARQRALEQLQAGEAWHGELTNTTLTGEPLRESVVVVPIRSSQGDIVNYVELKRDLSERVLAARRIHDLVYLDSLTGLPNRQSLVLYLRGLALSKQPVCHGLLLLDIDSFSRFNDIHGLQHSDELLHAISVRLVESLPEDVWVGRIGAAEFAIFFENIDVRLESAQQQLEHYARTLKQAVQRPFSLRNWSEAEFVSCCIGGALMVSGGDPRDNSEVLRFASVALHEAKQNGAGSVRLFEPRMAEDVIRRMRIAKDLRRGIAQGDLRLYLQTQTQGNGRCVGAEVLVRWQHPRWGLVSPVEFISVAEESELILSLGEWVMRQACQLLAQPVFADHGLRLSVNISAIQFGHEEFMPMLRSALEDSGANPHLLTLEITEGVVLSDINAARSLMQELRGMGIEIALDDFGTGYSSLYSLKHLPVQEIKIDQSFVRGSLVSEADSVMVEAMMLIAQRLQLRVVAEGVELVEQAQQLMQWSPDIVLQGMLLGEPLPEQQWLAQIKDHGELPDPDWIQHLHPA